MTSASTLSLLRKISTPVARETKNPKPRQLAYTAWGLICPMDTPEGPACGLTKSLSMMAHVRVGTFSTAVREQLDICVGRRHGIEHALDATPAQRNLGVPVLVNGALYMYADTYDTACALTEALRAMRRDSLIPFDTTVSQMDGHVMVDTDPGCLSRPLLRVEHIHDVKRLLRECPRART